MIGSVCSRLQVSRLKLQAAESVVLCCNNSYNKNESRVRNCKKSSHRTVCPMLVSVLFSLIFIPSKLSIKVTLPYKQLKILLSKRQTKQANTSQTIFWAAFLNKDQSNKTSQSLRLLNSLWLNWTWNRIWCTIPTIWTRKDTCKHKLKHRRDKIWFTIAISKK